MRQLVLVLTEFYWFFLLYRKCQPICSHRKNLNRSNSDADSVAQTCVTKTWLGSCGWWGSWLDRTCLWNKGVHCLPVVWEPEKGLFIHEYQVGECGRTVGGSRCKQLLHVALSPAPAYTGATGLDGVDIIIFCNVVRKLRFWCNLVVTFVQF